jgi:predicted alpha/beta-fold hydrolase
LRGCGPGKKLARYPYHAGRSEDTRSTLLWLAEHFPSAPVTQIGFSLGGNITLKMAGEGKPTGNLDSVIAVSAPLDLEASVKKIMKPSNKLFHDYFIKELVKHVRLNGEQPPLANQLYNFDNTYTAIRSGFKDAQDYYKRSSSGQFLNLIKVKTLILFSEDDPFISSDDLMTPFLGDNIDIIITKKGGHVGWLACPFRLKYFYWMDKTLMAWVKWLETSNFS